MNDEQIFLQTLHERPDDDTTRLVYADWLEDQEGATSHQRAVFLRLEYEIGQLSESSPARHALEDRLRAVAANLPVEWTALVSKRQLENCPAEFHFRCPKQWDQLAPTEQGSGVRHCGECNKEVYYCESLGTARIHAWLGRCVAVDARVDRSDGDLRLADSYTGPPTITGMMTMGVMLPPAVGEQTDVEIEPPSEELPQRPWWRRLFGLS